MMPREFHDQVVVPNRQDFAAHFQSLRHGLNAIATVDALAAHIFWALKLASSPAVAMLSMDDQYRHAIAGRNSAFRLVRDMAKAQKHVVLLKHNPQVTTASSVSVGPIGWGQLPFGRGRFGGIDQLVVQTAAGSADYVESLLDDAIAFLDQEMTSHGL